MASREPGTGPVWSDRAAEPSEARVIESVGRETMTATKASAAEHERSLASPLSTEELAGLRQDAALGMAFVGYRESTGVPSPILLALTTELEQERAARLKAERELKRFKATGLEVATVPNACDNCGNDFVLADGTCPVCGSSTPVTDGSAVGGAGREKA